MIFTIVSTAVGYSPIKACSSFVKFPAEIPTISGWFWGWKQFHDLTHLPVSRNIRTMGNIPTQKNVGTSGGSVIYHILHPWKLTWLAGQSPFSTGDTSSNVWFSIVMLVFFGGVSYCYCTSLRFTSAAARKLRMLYFLIPNRGASIMPPKSTNDHFPRLATPHFARCNSVLEKFQAGWP